ncbi:2-succinyl-6-hydroxy-2,4-cyclohexadiene-1-carboxylate synthase [Candidatus Phycosocius bacilliformis]|uniref:2-succinyl-6-hydroxy-2,4-cyclohexadiene-1-carboxylate synthase n=2 Tax=Candidatus Phycosocius bacilliformis TaxID=1445552 RepID=A0A2P2E9D3_9PROT|nr:2-succinyl-6-hydroxy-2,4-cyclohexadiene-1-carboxylate synthase [Candidatus Phycosocius bacilliformis]
MAQFRLMKFVFSIIRGVGLAFLVLLLGWMGTGLAMAAGGWNNPPRGVLIDVDGRKQRLVCQGEARAGEPIIVFEAGAYSGSADWGYLQPEVAKTARTCSYDRAGMGWSEPSKAPRDPATLARELKALLDASGEKGPYVLVGHSMAGLLTRAFISQYPDHVVGLVLIDAADPSAITIPEAQVWISRYQRLARIGAGLSQFGLVKPLAPFYANRIGLSGVPLQEKRRLFGSPKHMRASAAEITATIQGGEIALAADPYLKKMPVATITAGPVTPERQAWKQAQSRAARLSDYGSSINVDAANHTTILGPIYGRVVLEAIDRVRRDIAAKGIASKDQP